MRLVLCMLLFFLGVLSFVISTDGTAFAYILVLASVIVAMTISADDFGAGDDEHALSPLQAAHRDYAEHARLPVAKAAPKAGR